MFRLKAFLVFTLVATLLLFSSLLTPGLADGGANHRVRNMNFGVSGGNVNDSTRRFCCSGTLGALITDGTTPYVLSNNHVLARSDKAVVGEEVSQPGLIDSNCNIATVVADFSGAAPLGSNVDAAVAQLRQGQMDSSGFIEDIGVPSSTILSPSVGLSVAKSGRTTGFTTGSISSINTSVSVQYSANCGGTGKKTTISYTNQIVIGPGSFSAGGDSGSLIVANNAAHNPVGLLYAGSSSVTIANPIGEVLTRLGTALGRTFSFGGGGGGGTSSTTSSNQGGGRQPFIPGIDRLMSILPQQSSDRALAVLESHRANLMFQPGVMGAGIGASGRADGEAAIVIYVNKDAGTRAFLPDSIEGIPVTVILTDQFVAR